MFRNKKFRQAVSCAIDGTKSRARLPGSRAACLRVHLHGKSEVEQPNTPRYGFDPGRARSLLAEIGIQDRDNDGVMEDAEGHRIEIVFYSTRAIPRAKKRAHRSRKT